MSIKGMSELMRDFKEMKNIPQKDVKSATVKAAKIIVDAAKAKCVSSRVRSNIGYITTNDAKYPYVTLIGVKIKKESLDSFFKITTAGLAGILEYGAAERKPLKITLRRKTRSKAGEYLHPTYKRVLINGKWVTMSLAKPFKAIPARPFWRPAVDENRQRVQETLINELSQLIDKQANNLNLK